jgi:hypothetical protein
MEKLSGEIYLMAINRRDFIGGVIAVTSASQFASGKAIDGPDHSASPEGWLSTGLIDAGGTHEPYMFTVRRGGQRLDERQTSAYQQSEELIRRLHDGGVEVFHTHLYKGFGMEAEREEMEETRKAVAIAHSLGMKADTYIQWNSMMYETFFAEEPKAVDWIQRDVAGLPILLPYGYQQSFRYRPCFSNQNYLDYLKKVVRYAVVEVKTDFIHFDNFGLNAEPDSCHCPACTAGFRKRLKTKYSAAQLRNRFGFERVDFVNPPQWNRDNPPGQMQIIYDPAFQEWIDFRCQSMADALEQMFDYAASLNPEVALETNPAGITGQNRSWESGIDHARILRFTRAFWSEEGETIGYQPDGRLVSRIRSYKLARAYSNILLAIIADNALAFAETLAFNQTLGLVGSYPISPTTREYVEFYRQNRDRYVDSEDFADIGVLRSYASLTYNNAEVQLCTVLVEQALIEAGVPFHLVFDDGLRNLAKYKVLILPNSECLSDEQISLLRSYVESGGALVAIGQTGLYDEWRRLRIAPGLSEMIDHQEPASAYQESVGFRVDTPGTTARKTVGRGRVGHLPRVEFDGVLPPHQPYFAVTSEFWKRPKNWKDLVELVQWAAVDQGLIQLDGPPGVVVNYTGQISRQRVFVHLVNYNQAATAKSVGVGVRLPGGRQASRITVSTPGSNAVQTIAFSNNAPITLFSIPEVQTYSLVTIEL